jgi:hypothetical protein
MMFNLLIPKLMIEAIFCNGRRRDSFDVKRVCIIYDVPGGSKGRSSIKNNKEF